MKIKQTAWKPYMGSLKILLTIEILIEAQCIQSIRTRLVSALRYYPTSVLNIAWPNVLTIMIRTYLTSMSLSLEGNLSPRSQHHLQQQSQFRCCPPCWIKDCPILLSIYPPTTLEASLQRRLISSSMLARSSAEALKLKQVVFRARACKCCQVYTRGRWFVHEWMVGAPKYDGSLKAIVEGRPGRFCQPSESFSAIWLTTPWILGCTICSVTFLKIEVSPLQDPV